MLRIATALLCLAPLLAHAGHGEDFVLVDDPGGPAAGQLYLVGDLARTARADGSEAGLLLAYGATQRLELQLSASSQRDAGRWRYGGTTVEAGWTFTDPDADGLQLGLGVARTFAPGDDDASELRLGGSGDIGEATVWAANLYVERERGETTPGAALGLRRSVHDGLAVALEAERALRQAEGARVVASLHVDASDDWALKLALGGERGAERTAALVMLRAYVRVGR